MRIPARDINKHREGQGHDYECVEVSELGTLGTFICKNCDMQMQGTIVDWNRGVQDDNQVVIYFPIHYRRKGVYEWTSRWIPCPNGRRDNYAVPMPAFAVGQVVEGPSLIDRIHRVWRLMSIEDTGSFAMGYHVEDPNNIHTLRLSEMQHYVGQEHK